MNKGSDVSLNKMINSMTTKEWVDYLKRKIGNTDITESEIFIVNELLYENDHRVFINNYLTIVINSKDNGDDLIYSNGVCEELNKVVTDYELEMQQSGNYGICYTCDILNNMDKQDHYYHEEGVGIY